jgi:hypothetical protein
MFARAYPARPEFRRIARAICLTAQHSTLFLTTSRLTICRIALAMASRGRHIWNDRMFDHGQTDRCLTMVKPSGLFDQAMASRDRLCCVGAVRARA